MLAEHWIYYQAVMHLRSLLFIIFYMKMYVRVGKLFGAVYKLVLIAKNSKDFVNFMGKVVAFVFPSVKSL